MLLACNHLYCFKAGRAGTVLVLPSFIHSWEMACIRDCKQQAACKQAGIFCGGRVLCHVADSHNMSQILVAKKTLTRFTHCNKHDLSDYSAL